MKKEKSPGIFQNQGNMENTQIFFNEPFPKSTYKITMIKKYSPYYNEIPLMKFFTQPHIGQKGKHKVCTLREKRKVLKYALYIIPTPIRPKYTIYIEPTQKSQIYHMCKKFITKNMKSEKPLLQLAQKNYNTRDKSKIVKELQCRTNKFFNSSLPYLARLINNS